MTKKEDDRICENCKLPIRKHVLVLTTSYPFPVAGVYICPNMIWRPSKVIKEKK